MSGSSLNYLSPNNFFFFLDQVKPCKLFLALKFYWTMWIILYFIIKHQLIIALFFSLMPSFLDTFGRDKLKWVLVILLGDCSDKIQSQKDVWANKTIWGFYVFKTKNLLGLRAVPINFNTLGLNQGKNDLLSGSLFFSF